MEAPKCGAPKQNLRREPKSASHKPLTRKKKRNTHGILGERRKKTKFGAVWRRGSGTKGSGTRGVPHHKYPPGVWGNGSGTGWSPGRIRVWPGKAPKGGSHEGWKPLKLNTRNKRQNTHNLQTRHPLTTHICAVQSVHKRGTHTTRLAQVTRIAVSSLCASTCLTLCCSLTCRAPRAPHLPHSLFLLPPHKNTQHNRDNRIISKNTQYIMHISMLSQSTSSAIKNHSGGEYLQIGGNPRTTTPTGYEPQELATVSRIEDYPGDPYQ